MNNDLFIEMECKQFTKKGQVACGGTVFRTECASAGTVIVPDSSGTSSMKKVFHG